MVHDTGAAEAIVNDAVSKALERADVDQPRNFVAWLRAIAVNMGRHWIRDRKAEQRVLERPTPRSYRSAFSQAITNEALLVFDRELKRLTRMQRRILLMRIVDRLSYEEIGDKVRMKPGACRALALRARLNLRKWLGYMRAL